MIVIMRDAVMPECCKTCVCSEGYGCGITGTMMTTKAMESRPDWCPLEEMEPCEDAVSRQAAIDAICEDGTWLESQGCTEITMVERKQRDVDILSALPSAQHTLYGYKLEHLAYIARVMEKEGVTAEYAVRTFDDISRAVRMIIDEAQEKVEDMLNEQFNRQSSGD